MGFHIAPNGAKIETRFGQPSGTGSDQGLLVRLRDLFNSVPGGGTIKGSIYTINLKYISDALYAAANRGVTLQIMQCRKDKVEGSTSPNGDNMVTVMASLPGQRWTGGAGDDATHKWGAIASQDGADLHSKYFLLSQATGPDGVAYANVVIVTSANPSSWSGQQLSNDMQVIYGDATLYNNLLNGYHVPVWNEDHTYGVDFYEPPGRGKIDSAYVNLYASPSATGDMWVNRLDDFNNDTNVEVYAAFGWLMAERQAVYDKLIAMKQAGAWVQVAAGKNYDTSVVQQLQGAGIAVKANLRMHNKSIIVSANGGAKKVVFAGSHNLNNQALRVNDELISRTHSVPGVYDDYKAHYDWLWANLSSA